MKWERKTKTDVEIETSAGIITFPPGLNLTEEQVAAFRDVFNGVTHATCDATDVVQGFFGTPVTLGPCVLRHNHDGPGHKGANGAQWWPTGHTHAGTANSVMEDQ